MRLTRKKHGNTPFGLNMAAMVDVVFQLNIFFLVTSSALQMEKELPTQMPEVDTSVVKPAEFEPIRLRLSRTTDGILVACDGTPVESFDVLAGMLKARRAIADVPVIIEGQETVPFGNMISALDACYRADLKKVAFSAAGVSP
jgi:biopolymer transport protein ExbD